MNEVLRLIILLFSFLGYGIFINRKFKIPGSIIPIFLFSAIIIAEYFAAIVNLLSLTTDLLIFGGLALSVYYIFNYFNIIRTKIFSGFIRMGEILEEQKDQLIRTASNLRQSGAILFWIPLIFCFSISISIRIAHYWNQPLKIKISILVGILVIISVLFLITYSSISKSIAKNKKILITSLAISIICAFIFIPSKLLVTTPLPPKTNMIEIINTGNKNNSSAGSDIKLIEIKDSITQEKIVEDKYKSQIIQINDLTCLLIDEKVKKDVFYFDSNHVSNFEILFITDNSSGQVKINVNGNEIEKDLFSDSANLALVKTPIRYDALTFLLLFSDVISFILIVFIFCWIYINGYRSDRKESNSNPIIKPGFVIFSILIIALFFITKDYLFHSWDEFTSWGTLIKEIAITNVLPVKPFCSVFPYYVPGFSLFQYFIIRVVGYTEGHVYYANSIFILAGIYLIIAEFDWHRLLTLFVVILCFLRLLSFLPLMFFSLYVDVLLGILFGAGCIAYLIFTDKKINLFYLLVIISAIQLIKIWGLFFAGCIFCFVVCHQLFVSKKNGNGPTLKKELILFTLLFILLTVIIQGSWQIHLSINNMLSPDFYNSNDNYYFPEVTGIIKDFNYYSVLMSRSIDILINGRNNQGLNRPLTILNITGILIILGIILSFLNKKKKKEILIIDLLLTSFFIIDIIILALTIIFYFSPSESARLASFERYISEYLLGWFLIIFFLLNMTINDIKEQKYLQLISFIPISMFILLFLVIKQQIYFQVPPKELISERSEISQTILKYPSIEYNGKTRTFIYNIDQNSRGLEHAVLRFELCPNIIQRDGWSIATSRGNYGRFTVQESMNEFNNQINKGFDFVLITEADESFWRDYGKLFPGYSISGSQLYKVTDQGLVRAQ